MKVLAHKEPAHSRTHLSSQVAKLKQQTTHSNFPSYKNSRLPEDLSESSHTLKSFLFLFHFILCSMHAPGWRWGSRGRCQHFIQPKLVPVCKGFCFTSQVCTIKPSLASFAILEQGFIQVYALPLTITLSPKCKCV